MNKINELAESASVEQGGEEWCYDMKLAPDEYIAHNGCRLAYIEYDFITPLGDICAFDEEYFRKSVKAWKAMPEIPSNDLVTQQSEPRQEMFESERFATSVVDNLGWNYNNSQNLSIELHYPCDIICDEDGFTATFPDVPEAITCGETYHEVMNNLHDCLKTALELYKEDERFYPKPSQIKDQQFNVVVIFDGTH